MPTGHALIQVSQTGQNCIILFGGANQAISREQIDETLSHFDQGDILLLQNEINNLPYLVDQAYQKGMTIFLNPSPITEQLKEIDLSKISYLVLNEIEAADLSDVTARWQYLSGSSDSPRTVRIQSSSCRHDCCWRHLHRILYRRHRQRC